MLSVVAYFNTKTQEAEAGGSMFEDSLVYKDSNFHISQVYTVSPCLKRKKGVWRWGLGEGVSWRHGCIT